jgi:hypothetical protein
VATIELEILMPKDTFRVAFCLVWFAAIACGTTMAVAEVPPELTRWLAPQKWERDTDGPILSLGTAGQFDDTHIFAPAVARENDRYLLWYCGSRGTPDTRVFHMGLARSADGRAFERNPGGPVLQFADGKHSLITPTLLRAADGTPQREDGKLRMWFSSARLDGGGGTHKLHDATSADGVGWSEPSPPMLENCYAPSVVKVGDRYHLWYTDVSRRPWKFRHASSADGRAWDVTSDPVMELGQAWENEILVYPTVLHVEGVYLMWYGSYTTSRRQETAIGFAASTDGLSWHRHPNNPVLSPDPKRAWESNYVGNQSVIRLPDGSFRMWYASRKKPPFRNLYFAINTAKWAGPGGSASTTTPPQSHVRRCGDGL